MVHRGPAEEPPRYDKRLWFRIRGCPGKHFLLGNAHTHLGRISAWCPSQGLVTSVGFPEIEEMPPEARFWVQGFLSGNEPDYCGLDQDGRFDPEGQQYRKWVVACATFLETGTWPHPYEEDRCYVCGGSGDPKQPCCVWDAENR